MEQEDRIYVEELCVNLNCVKKELEEEEDIELNFENVFVESWTEQRSNRDSLIGSSDNDDVRMETGRVKLEDVKEENKDLIRKTIEQFHCNECGGNYQGYCLNCSSLSHILNNITPNLNLQPVLNTTPRNILEIREVLRGCAVFPLKTLPKGIILGPFEGIVPIESTTGVQWKIKDRKLVNAQNGNWMKYIQSVANHASKNLDVFQIDGILYFETSREIQEGEELLVCYREEKQSDKEEEFYLVPVKKEEFPKVFACTLCCLGFRLESCLVEHKNKCPQGNHGGNIKDFEIIQCNCCKVWLEKEEHLESHMQHCLDNPNRSCRNRNLPDFPATYTNEEDEQLHANEQISTSIDVNASYATLPSEPIDSKNCFSRIDFKVHADFLDRNMGTIHSSTNEKKYKCSECSYQTNRKGNLDSHRGTHIKNFQCDICKQRFGHKNNLKLHMKNKHSNTAEMEYKCSECSYQTNLKYNLKTHLVSHGDVKDFQCGICKQSFGRKDNLNVHMKNKHSNTDEKVYKCSECYYQTNRKHNLKIHMETIHSNTNEKKYKCSECVYETNRKGNLDSHLGTHIKNFECDICKQRFGQKSSLQLHMKTKHSNTTEMEYKCPDCSYQTNRKYNLKIHLGTHTDVKDLQCDICNQTFGHKSSLNLHVRTKHSNTSEKEYKCSECTYQTNFKGNLKIHINTHADIKHFQCDICKQRFGHKGNLNVHMKKKHSNTIEKV